MPGPVALWLRMRALLQTPIQPGPKRIDALEPATLYDTDTGAIRRHGRSCSLYGHTRLGREMLRIPEIGVEKEES